MTEVDMLLRDTLSDRAEAAPTGAGLLARVHTRSRLIRRRRRVGAVGQGVPHQHVDLSHCSLLVVMIRS